MRTRVRALALGQVLSLLVTGTGFSSTLLASYGVDAPSSQTLLNYFLLAVVYGSRMLYRQQPIKARWYFYFVFAIIDFEANYIAVKAYQYTSITSVMLLDCWSIPCVLLLTWLFLQTHYSYGHFLGGCICVMGLILCILSDAHSDNQSGGSNMLFGDMLVFVAATLYAISNVLEEFLVKRVDQAELLALVGSFGTVISACQILLLERSELYSLHWNASIILPFIGFATCMFTFSTFVPVLLQWSGSAMLNLSLLTSDMWAVAIRSVVFHQSVDWLYFVAFATVAVGLIVYGRSEAPGAVDEGHSTGNSLVKGTVYKQVEFFPAPNALDAAAVQDCLIRNPIVEVN